MTGNSTDPMRISKLTETNFLIWDRLMTSLLKRYKVWKIVNGSMNMEQFLKSKGIETATGSSGSGTSTRSSTVTQIDKLKTEWEELDDLAIRTLLLPISFYLLFEYDNCTTSDVLYAKICKRYKHGLANSITHLRLQLHEVQLNEEGSVEAYYQKLSRIISEMIFAGYPVPEDEKVNVMLKGLPQDPDWRQINMFMLQTPDAKFDSVIHLLRGHKLQLVREENISTDAALYAGQSKVASKAAGSGSGRSMWRCTNCKRKGHTIEKCYAKGGGQEGQGLKRKNHLTIPSLSSSILWQILHVFKNIRTDKATYLCKR